MNNNLDYVQKLVRERPGSAASAQGQRSTPRRTFFGRTAHKKKLIVVAAAAISVIVLIVFFLSRDRKHPTGDLAYLDTRIAKLEARLTQLEATTGKLILERKGAAIPDLPGAQPPSPSRTAGDLKDTRTRPVEGRYHEVQRGDSLSMIAEQYNLSLNQLCRLNGINPNDTIYPGQKLLVDPSRPD